MSLTPALIFAALLAHLPSISEDDYVGYDEAFFLEDVEKSIVLYDVVSCEAPEVWLSFQTLEPEQAVFLQLGVPVIDWLADYRPAVALLAPGLPAIDLPFAVPDGVGGVRFDAADTEQPADFYEPFTMTSSWIWYEGNVVVPEPGQGWIVAWDPAGRTGKLWVAVGTVEDFSSGIGVTLEQIWTYHESPGYEPDPPGAQQQCELGGDTGGETGGDTGGETGTSGSETGSVPGLDTAGEGCSCATTRSPSLGWMAWMGLLLGGLALRRRRC